MAATAGGGGAFQQLAEGIIYQIRSCYFHGKFKFKSSKIELMCVTVFFSFFESSLGISRDMVSISEKWQVCFVMACLTR